LHLVHIKLEVFEKWVTRTSFLYVASEAFGIQKILEIGLVGHSTEVNGGQVFEVRFQQLHESVEIVFLVVKGQ
jgi:hypothetical protein